MLTPKQVKTIEFDARIIVDGHLATLQGISNGVLHELTPGNQYEYGKHFETLISKTVEVISALGERAAREVPNTVLALKNDLNEKDRDKVLAIWRRHLDTDLYRRLIEKFKESFGRRMRSYGTEVQLSTFRFDLIESRYLASTTNASRQAAEKLKHALDVRVYADRLQREQEPRISFLEKANQVIDLKPNWFGLGININKLIENFLRRGQRQPEPRPNIIAHETIEPAVSEVARTHARQLPEHGASSNRSPAIPLIQLRQPSPFFDDRYELLNPDHRHLLSLSRHPTGITLGEIRGRLAIEQNRLEKALRYLVEQELLDQSTDTFGKVSWRLSEAGQAFLKGNPWARLV